MQGEVVQFDAMSTSRPKRPAAGVALGHRKGSLSGNSSSSTVLDEVFASYSRVDAGSSREESAAKLVPSDGRTTRELIADISTQLKTLESQRRQLARLLETVRSDATAE
jgi:hypothetical protein